MIATAFIQVVRVATHFNYLWKVRQIPQIVVGLTLDCALVLSNTHTYTHTTRLLCCHVLIFLPRGCRSWMCRQLEFVGQPQRMRGVSFWRMKAASFWSMKRRLNVSAATERWSLTSCSGWKNGPYLQHRCQDWLRKEMKHSRHESRLYIHALGDALMSLSSA